MQILLTCRWTGVPCGVNRKIVKAGQFIVNRSQYTKFKEGLAWTMRQAKTEPLYKGDVALSLYPHTRHDVDAFVKPALDGLQMSGVIKNDRQVKQLHVAVRPPDEDNTIDIVVWRLHDQGIKNT